MHCGALQYINGKLCWQMNWICLINLDSLCYTRNPQQKQNCVNFIYPHFIVRSLRYQQYLVKYKSLLCGSYFPYFCYSTYYLRLRSQQCNVKLATVTVIYQQNKIQLPQYVTVNVQHIIQILTNLWENYNNFRGCLSLSDISVGP